MDVIFGIQKLRFYLLSDEPFKDVTDKNSVQYKFQKRAIHGKLKRWMELIDEYDFKVKYRKESDNGAATFSQERKINGRAIVMMREKSMDLFRRKND